MPDKTKTVPFDRIVILEGSTEREVAPADFMEIGLHKRMTMILEDRVQFFDGGTRLVTMSALKALYDASLSAAA